MTTVNAARLPQLTANGQLIVGSGTAQPVATTLTQGANMTITNGAGSITLAATAGGSGALTFIASVTASSSATADFSNNLSSTYDNYLCVFENVINATNTQRLQAIVGTGAGPSYQASSYIGVAAPLGNGNASWQASGTTALDMQSSSIMQTNTTSNGMGGYLYVHNVNDATNFKSIEGMNTCLNSTTQICTGHGGQWRGATVLTSLRFSYSSGNITSGIFKLYGIQN